MTFYDPTLYGRDEEEEFGDSGAYSESLEEDFEEEEEEEESGTPSGEMHEPESISVPPPPAKPSRPKAQTRPICPERRRRQARSQKESGKKACEEKSGEEARQEKGCKESCKENCKEKGETGQEKSGKKRQAPQITKPLGR